MQTTTVFLILIALSVISFSLGRRRSRSVAQKLGGLTLLHSLPKHYGYMAALWAALPALLVLVLWLSFEGDVLAKFVRGGLVGNQYTRLSACVLHAKNKQQ